MRKLISYYSNELSETRSEQAESDQGANTCVDLREAGILLLTFRRIHKVRTGWGRNAKIATSQAYLPNHNGTNEVNHDRRGVQDSGDQDNYLAGRCLTFW